MPPTEPEPASNPGMSLADLSLLSWDEAQELKEGVADALTERMRHVVCGEGEHGRVFYGDKPSRILSSGFLLPRINARNDEEVSDISIAAHGMDLRVVAHGEGVIRVRPSFSVYARAIPDEDEVFGGAAGGVRLRPKARLNPDARRHIRDVIRSRVRAEGAAGSTAEKLARRRRITVEVYREMGIGVPEEGVPIEDLQVGANEDDAELDRNADRDLQIPAHLAVPYAIPDKYVRLEVTPPVLELPLPYDAEEWRRRADGYSTSLRGVIRETYAAWLATDEGREQAWRRGRVPSTAFWSRESWGEYVRGLRGTPPNLDHIDPRMELKFLVQGDPEVMEPGVVSLRLAIENYRERTEEHESGIFHVFLSVEVPSGVLRQSYLERIKRSYHLDGLLGIPATGVNGGVRHHEEDGAHRLTTSWAPRFVLPRMQPTRRDVEVGYGQLSDYGFDVARLHALPRSMADWIEEVERSISPTLFEPGEEVTELDRANERSNFDNDMSRWREERDRIELGVSLLVESREAYLRDPKSEAAIPYKAWVFTNRAFLEAAEMAARGKEGDLPKPGWRLFQLAFVLTHLPTLASRVPSFERYYREAFDELAASLLYMSTGGGKSEAFFGVLVFALFFDRLRGKRRGVTAMIHYPLRLLTLQQAQRLMGLLARAEMIRRDEELGGAPFEIGFWVGSSNTPNDMNYGDFGSEKEEAKDIPAADDPSHFDEEALRDAVPAYAQKADAWNKLPRCPFCDGEGTVLRKFPERHWRLGIVCLDPECEWSRAHGGGDPEPLPFLLVDKDIYRHAPSVLLGTIDKLALIGNNPLTINRLAGMFGLARWIEGDDDTGLLFSPNYPKTLRDGPPSGMRTVAPAYRGGADIFLDPLPSLIIQDELHLLEESLGTFGGIFETTLFALFEEFAARMGKRACRIPNAPERFRMPHVIGATATATDVARQMANLYMKNVCQFPHPGPRLYRSFYSELAEFRGTEARAARTQAVATARQQETAAPWGRVYITLLTNGRPHTATTISVLSAYACGVTRWTRDLASGDPAKQRRAADEMVGAVLGNAANPWRERQAAVMRRYAEQGRWDVLVTLVDLHRIALTYVTNKKGGDQLLSALGRQADKDHRAMGASYVLSKFLMELISGGVDVKTIQGVILKARRPFAVGQEDIDQTLRAIVATSAISHGVDVDNFNAMFFAGAPSDIAEYIQASSRVGRTHVGFSVLIPTPQNRRDRFIVDLHEPYHRFLERMISPPAIERWADKAVRRTVPSLFQAFFAGVLHQRYFVAAGDAEKADVTFPRTVADVRNEMTKDRSGARISWDKDTGKAVVDDCIAFVQRAVGLRGTVGGAPVPDHYERLIRDEIGNIQGVIEVGDYTGDLSRFWEAQWRGLPKPMTSLRDVDEAGEISAAPSTPRVPRISSERLAAAMRLIRNRRAGDRRSAADGSETDTDTDDGSED
ncbi:hypothetical protein M0638_22925 [Roseomonas sp. NAR14]|uniref:Helicase C-terminal domain-containing protein n=1 Tax=Roseomonas acroporae TaxID=2937791 RepID=A0A9X1YJD4_9PROT|nr:DEAD/DEAH box helicase family protein [Roseomonas acroporae]MCK8787231.1 hypothetical protein [Roseomonas acroporae]